LEAVEGQLTLAHNALSVASLSAIIGAASVEEISWKLDEKSMQKIVEFATQNSKAN
jgi:hypothetical protein